MFNAIVSWPIAPVTKSLVLNALRGLECTVVPLPAGHRNLFWSTYDDIDHELVHSNRDTMLSSSYTFRKALIRKHFLSRCLQSYITKHPDSKLKTAAPKTFEIELSFVDELDEMFLDELWELGKELEGGRKWWILKPGMADRGNGIRIFNSKMALEKIFDDFEEADSDVEDESGGEEDKTAVVTSQLRHFVIQEYLSNPLLIDPAQVSIDDSSKPEEPQGFKFHLRAYCVASCALQLFLFDKILALFSAVPYIKPSVGKDEDGDPLPLDLSPHLTNTSLQTDRGEEGVRLLEELVSCQVLSGPQDAPKTQFTSEDMKTIVDQMVIVLGETFKAALENPIHFQPLPNAFELFGIDFLVTDSPSSSASQRFEVKLLEINAEPAIELTGPRLSWILQDLFTAIGKVCVDPFFSPTDAPEWPVGASRHGLIKCLDEEVRGPAAAQS
ncbi:TTL-domain-containing protein [Mycena maculata]|uniref:TTL-domain-containing protein n=1 Tax=Mycena maculata TaxID=230809 RepID=A0AAD7P178_9AGAR|nr:TTL-domain-containing protein [Mycena maculata]